MKHALLIISNSSELFPHCLSVANISVLQIFNAILLSTRITHGKSNQKIKLWGYASGSNSQAV